LELDRLPGSALLHPARVDLDVHTVVRDFPARRLLGQRIRTDVCDLTDSLAVDRVVIGVELDARRLPEPDETDVRSFASTMFPTSRPACHAPSTATTGAVCVLPPVIAATRSSFSTFAVGPSRTTL